ncbi:MAG: alpha/beta hydrolase [Terriglobia bacterium]
MDTPRYRWLSALAVVAVIAVLQGCNPLNYPTGTIELKYYASGPWAVTVSPGAACCDSSGNRFDLYYPTNLGANGFLHPILTWGNGTNSLSSNYAYLLTHMASWGFVVIATEDKNTGAGQTILDAANFLVTANNNAASPFFHKLNVNQIGAFGHSQGASGAINAVIKSAGSIKTVVPIELPAQVWCGSPQSCTDTRNLVHGSIFLVDGSADFPISPPTQLPQIPGEQSIQAYYDVVPSGITKLKGTLIGPNHNDVQGQPSCTGASPPCFNGVYGYLGYPTAWMMYQLQGDAFAHGAFVNATGEMFSETKNWELVASNVT